MSIQSSTSSSSKDTEHEKWLWSARRSLTSSLLADSNIDNGEHGQQLLTEPISDRLADILPNFEQSPLAESSQPTSNQDGGDIFDLTVSPFSFSSTILPCTYPELFQPAVTGTSEDPFSASPRSGDEIPPCLPRATLDYTFSIDDPPTRKSHNSSLSELGSNATPTTLPESASVWSAFPSQIPTGQLCQCLPAVVFAVGEFEAGCNAGDRAELDSIVAYQKEAIKCCYSMLKCSSCAAKRENLVLLVFVAEKIVAACSRTVGLYRMRDGEAWADSVPSSLSEYLPFDRSSYRVNVEDRHLATSAPSSSSKTDCMHSGPITPTRTSTSSYWRELLLGDYEVSSPLEWEHLVRVLIGLQLRAVMGLLADIKSIGSRVLGETQTASLAQAEVAVGELEKGMKMI